MGFLVVCPGVINSIGWLFRFLFISHSVEAGVIILGLILIRSGLPCFDTMFIMADSTTGGKTHGKKYPKSSNTKHQAQRVHNIKKSSASDIDYQLKILAQELAVEACDHAVIWICNGVDSSCEI